MSMNYRSRSLVFGLATAFALTLFAPAAINAEEEIAVLAPVAVPSWDETSGYGVVEASRATIGHPAASTSQVPADVRWAPARAFAPTSSIEASRVLAAQQVLQSQNLGSLQEDALLAVVAAGSFWDQTSGYGSVEASRATIGHPVANTSSQKTRVLTAQQALLSQDLGSLQEDALTAVVQASSAEVNASVTNASAPTSTELLAQFRAVEQSLSRYLGAN